MIDDACNCGVGEGGVGECRGGGFLEVDGRKVGMEYVGRGFSTISSDLIVYPASTDSIFSTNYWLGSIGSTGLKLKISS